MSAITDINGEEFWLTYNNKDINKKNKIYEKIGKKL